MKGYLILFSIFLFTTALYAQKGLDTNSMDGISIPSSDTNINATKSLDINGNANTQTIDLKNPLTEPKSFSIEKNTELMDAGVELEKRWKDKEIKERYRRDQYLGDFKAKGDFLSIECRDHEYVDGDKVSVYVNGNLVEASINLTSWYKGINVDLKSGFNQIDFIALNQGSSGPNTAQFRVFDQAGLLITSQEWNLTTGAKATIIVVKE